MARFPIIMLILMVLAASMVLAADSSLIMGEASKESVRAVFPMLKVNDAQGRTATFTMDTPAENILSVNDFAVKFNEVCGHVISYRILTEQPVVMERPLFKDQEYCSDISILDNKTGKNTTQKYCEMQQIQSGTEKYETTDWLPVQSLDAGLKDYKIDADIKWDICPDGTWGYQIDWIPVLNSGNFIYSTNYIQEEWAWWNTSMGLLAYYKMDNGAGNPEPDANLETPRNNLDQQGTIGSTAGIINTARGPFYTTSTFFQNNSLNFSLGYQNSWSIVFWARMLNSTLSVLWEVGDSTASSNWIDVYTDGTYMVFEYQEVGGHQCSLSTIVRPKLGEWEMYTLTHNAVNNYNYIYANTTSMGSVLLTNCISANPSAKVLTIGKRHDGYPLNNGYIDEFMIFNRTLTTDDITQLYNGGAGLPYEITSTLTPNITSVTFGPTPAYDETNLSCNVTIVGSNSTYLVAYSIFNGTDVKATGTTDGVVNNTNTQVALLPGSSTNVGGRIFCQVNATDGIKTSPNKNDSQLITGILRLSYWPAQLNTSNLFGADLIANYTIYANNFSNQSVFIYHKTNTSIGNVNFYVNGTAVTDWQPKRYEQPNTSTLFTFYLDDNDVYGGVAKYNYDEDSIENAAHNQIVLNDSSTIARIQILNVNATGYNYSFFEMMVNNTAADTAVTVAYCNNTNACTNIYTFSPNIPNHCHTANSCHALIPFVLNSTGYVGSGVNAVKVTPISYFQIAGRNGANHIIVYGPAIVSRQGAAQLSTNGGTTWVNYTGMTFDAHLHQMRPDTTYYVYACYNDSQRQVCSTTRAQQISGTPFVPSSANVFSPLNQTYGGRVYINWTEAASLSGTITSYNITLSNLTTNLKYISTNIPTNLSASFCAQDYNATGIYAQVTAYTSDGLSSLGFSQQFNTNSSLAITALTPTGLTYTSLGGSLPYLIAFSCAVRRGSSDIPMVIDFCFTNSTGNKTCVVGPIAGYQSIGSYYQVNYSANFSQGGFWQDGRYNWTCAVESADCVVGQQIANRSFIVNTHPPSLTIDQPTNGQVFVINANATWPVPLQFNYTASSPFGLDVFGFAGDNMTGGTVIGQSFLTNISGFGLHFFRVSVNDTTGLQSNATVSFRFNREVVIAPGYGSSYYTDYLFGGGYNATSPGQILYYSGYYSCLNLSLTGHFWVNGTILASQSLTCNGMTNDFTGNYNHTVQGAYDVQLSFEADDNSFNSTYGIQQFLHITNAPTVTAISMSLVGGGFTNGTSGNIPIKLNLTCTDGIVPMLTYSFILQNLMIYNSNFSSGTHVGLSTQGFPNVQNNFTGVCANAFYSASQTVSQTFYYQFLYLIEELTGGPFDVTNITSMKVYWDNNMTMYDFHSYNASNITYITSSLVVAGTRLRFEFGYSSGAVINRYIDLNLINNPDALGINNVRVCGDYEGTTFYEQILQSASSRPTLMLSTYAQCYVAVDYTRFALQDLYILKAFSIARAYRIYRFDSNGVAQFLVDVDGSTQQPINLDTIELYQTQYNLTIQGEGMGFQAVAPGQVYIYYKNGMSGTVAAQLDVYRQDTGALVYTYANMSNPSEFSTTFSYGGMLNITNASMFRATVSKSNNLGVITTFSRYFGTGGSSYLLSSGFAVVFAILMTLFGITFAAAKPTVGWVGMVGVGASLILLSMAVPTWYTTLFIAVDGVMLIFIVFTVAARGFPELFT